MHCSPRILHFCLLIHSFLVNLPSYLLGTVMAPWTYCKRYIDMLKYCLLYKTWLMTELTQVRRFLYKKNSLGNGRIPSMMLGIAFSMIFNNYVAVACHCMSLGLTMFARICNWWLSFFFIFKACAGHRLGILIEEVRRLESGEMCEILKLESQVSVWSQGRRRAPPGATAKVGDQHPPRLCWYHVHPCSIRSWIPGRHFPSQPLNWPCMKHHWVFSIL